MATYTYQYRGQPPLNGNLDTPANAMARGIGVVRDGTTIDEAAAAELPYGFLNNEVTVDGPSYEEMTHIAGTVHDEVKISEGKIQVILYQEGNEYFTTGNVTGAAFAVGDPVYQVADGKFAAAAGAAVGDLQIGVVEEIDVTNDLETGFVWKAIADHNAKT